VICWTEESCYSKWG